MKIQRIHNDPAQVGAGIIEAAKMRDRLGVLKATENRLLAEADQTLSGRARRVAKAKIRRMMRRQAKKGK